jgi:MFS family permease
MTDTPPSRLGAGYWKLWTGNVVSNFGDGISALAYPWLASAVTRNPVAIALVGVSTRLPWLVFTLPAGVITDRVDRRRLVAWMDVIRLVITLVVGGFVLAYQRELAAPDAIAAGAADIPASGGLLLGMIYVTGLALGVCEVLRDNGAQTLLPSIVSKDQLQRANGRMWGAEMVTNQFAGPVAGGLLLAVAFSLPFFVDAGTFAVAAAMTFLIAGDFKPKNANGSRRRSIRTEMKEGFGWLWSRPFLRSLAISLGLLNLLGTMTQATLVLFVQEILDLDAAGFAILMWAGAAGGIVGSLTAERVSKRLGNGNSLFLTIGASVVISAVIGLTSSAPIVWVVFVAFSFTAVLWNVITVSLRQTIIPDHLLGRVNSVYRMFGWGMMPVGALAGGFLVNAGEALWSRSVGLRLPFLVSAGVHVVLYVWALPRLNDRQIEAALEEAPH